MKSKWILMAALTTVLSMVVPIMAQTPTAASPKDQTQQTPEKKAVKAKLPAPTDQEISDAKAKGMVWANTKTKVYHQADSQFYGKTKHGRFMTKDEAAKAGYKVANEAASKNTKSGAKKSATQATK
jgi:hypothetical protein